MKAFIAGVVVTLLVLSVLGFLYAELGFLPTNADATPSALEQRIANGALDASMDRHAPSVANPVAATDENLIDGAKIYTMNCASCHGTMDYKANPLEYSLYPPAPQLLLYPPHDPEGHIFYAIRTGIRYTGMPAWSKTLSEEEMWKVTAFLSHLKKLPPGVQAYWKNAYGVVPRAGQGEGHGK
jgi:mono/diheme cytochrome c family protein